MHTLFRLLKRFMAMFLIVLTLGQAFMPEEIVYARNNNPKRFVLRLKEALKQDIDQREAGLVFRVLHLFPESFYGSLNKITLYFKHDGHPRGRANHREIQLRTAKMSVPEMLAVFIHELAHVYDLGTAKGSKRGTPTNFKFKNGDRVKADDPSFAYYDLAWSSTKRKKKGIKKELDFASTYGASSPFEDFGEAFVFYVLHGEEFVRRSKQSAIMKDKYLHLWGRVFRGERFDFSTSKAYPRNLL